MKMTKRINLVRIANQHSSLSMVGLKLMIAALSLVSLVASAGSRSMEPSVIKRTEPSQELAPMPRELQAATRARCSLLSGPEYHACLYAVIMRPPTRGWDRTRATHNSG
jgi:hypothetical protein